MSGNLYIHNENYNYVCLSNSVFTSSVPRRHLNARIISFGAISKARSAMAMHINENFNVFFSFYNVVKSGR